MPDLRPFTPTDQDGLVAAINAVCAEGCWMSTPRFQPTPGWQHMLESPTCPHHLLLVAEDESRIVGWCRLLPTTCADGAPEAELGIGLLPAYRGQGLGTGLVRLALAWAGATGLQRAWLTTRADNARAIHVFTRCGFHLLDVSDNRVTMMHPVCDVASQGENVCD